MTNELAEDYDLVQVAKALKMSERWVRQQVANGAVHMRFGHKIRFTAEQVEMLRASCVRRADVVVESITTGRGGKKSA